ncbi:MAG: hypothetical protein CME39_09795 [Haliea sp.]|nr:hypothetical protein [Haliea sp.]|tara:strand:- start:319 stop:528 length:210 start_codon:yes stop_codon:yes gene_type:complete
MSEQEGFCDGAAVKAADVPAFLAQFEPMSSAMLEDVLRGVVCEMVCRDGEICTARELIRIGRAILEDAE